MPTCDIGRSELALCLKTATTVAAIEKPAKKIATMAVIREKESKPDKERKVTDMLNTMTALQRQWMVSLGKQREKEGYIPQDKCMHG